MLRILTWTICVYAVIKGAHAIARPGGGYAAPRASFRDRARSGEPMLLIGALAFVVAITTYSTWWHHRLARREYAHSKGCYVELETAKLLPRERTRLDPFDAEDQAAVYLWNGQYHGSWLGWRPDAIRQDFDRASRSYRARYASNASPTKEPDLLHDVGRCFRDEWAAHGEIFNP